MICIEIPGFLGEFSDFSLRTRIGVGWFYGKGEERHKGCNIFYHPPVDHASSGQTDLLV
jgi:hypothetical protein